MNRHLTRKLSWVYVAATLGAIALNSFKQGYRQFLEGRLKLRSLRTAIPLFLMGVGLSVAIAACSSPGSVGVAEAKPNVELNLVSFSVTKAAHDALIPKFVEQWKREHNQTITFKQSYGGSAAQALTVIEGANAADIVHLSLAPDIKKLEQAGLIQPGWEQEFPHDGIVSKSVVTIVTREGNPKGIQTWADLTKSGVTVVTANPQTSGGARWNFLALWNAAIKSGADESKANDFITQVYRNVPTLPESAREATDTFFKKGEGDVLLTYENEVLLAALNGEKVPHLVPAINFSIDNPVAIVDTNVDKHGTREVAEAFVKYLYTPEAQEEFAKVGYRSIDPSVAQEKAFVARYPQVKTLATVQDYGGWDAIQKKFFDENGLFVKVLKYLR